MLRTRHRRVADLGELEELVASATGPVTLVFDTDGTVVPQGADEQEFRTRVAAVRSRFEALPHVHQVVMISNGPPRGGGVTPRVGKPFTPRDRLGLRHRTDDVWIIGDQIISDGLLAWRFRGRFVELAISEGLEPPDQVRQRAWGRRIAPLFLRRWI